MKGILDTEQGKLRNPHAKGPVEVMEEKKLLITKHSSGQEVAR